MQVSFLIDIENLKPDRVLSGSNPCPVLHGRQRCYFSTFYQRIPRLLHTKILAGQGIACHSMRSFVLIRPWFPPGCLPAWTPGYLCPGTADSLRPGFSPVISRQKYAWLAAVFELRAKCHLPDTRCGRFQPYSFSICR